jgi:hypothetical protein
VQEYCWKFVLGFFAEGSKPCMSKQGLVANAGSNDGTIDIPDH